MKKLFTAFLLLSNFAFAQDRMTPEMLWSLKRVSGDGVSDDGRQLFYSAKQVDWKTEKSTIHHYSLSLSGGSPVEVPSLNGMTIVENDKSPWYATDDKNLYTSIGGKNWKPIYSNLENAGDVRVSPNGKYVAFSREVLIKPMLGTDLYPDLPNTKAQVYTDLTYRHWDTWEDGKFSHIFVANIITGKVVDIMEGEPYDCPGKPFGGKEDFVWAHDSRGVVYSCKKKFGKEYALSTNTDLYHYDVTTGETHNWTKGMTGYDNNPQYSPDGKHIAWLSMAHDGFEADKNDLVVMDIASGKKQNITKDWNGDVGSFVWSKTGDKIYYTAPWRGTEQLFEIRLQGGEPHEITNGQFDVTGIVGQSGKDLIVSRTDMNHSAELYAVNPSSGTMRQLTHENDDVYSRIALSKVKRRMIKTTDGKDMLAWVIYPPDFDSTKKYPTLLYCQGGPQSALSQFYSVRWNFQLMAANGYIIIAPNRRGMPGWGTKWNADISKDWGGQPMRDYLSAIDDISKESYVDKNRLGCVGASYGGYSVYMLAGMHNNRFKTFIAHDGLFDLKSWYGTTEELWFANWDIGGAYWSSPLF